MARFRVNFDPQAGRSATTIEADSWDLDANGVLRFRVGAGQQQKVVRIFSPRADWWDIEQLSEGQQ
jgi:hypothetical protein